MHIPHLLLSSGIVERTNGLLKHVLKPQNSRWPAQLSDAIAKVSSCCGGEWMPQAHHTLSQTPFATPGEKGHKGSCKTPPLCQAMCFGRLTNGRGSTLNPENST